MPYNTWYANSAIGYHTDGTLFPNSEAIRTEAIGFMKPFERIDMDVHVIRLVPGMVVREKVQRDEENGEVEMTGDLVMLETTAIFFLKGITEDNDGIRVPRLINLLIGKAEELGEGTDGLQIFEAKSWWDSWILVREMEKRKLENVHSDEMKDGRQNDAGEKSSVEVRQAKTDSIPNNGTNTEET